MKVILNNSYRIESFPLGYTLIKTTITYGNADNKSDKPRLVEKEVGYWTTIEGPIRKFVDVYLHDELESFEGDLEEYIKRIQEIVKSIKEEKVSVIVKEINK